MTTKMMATSIMATKHDIIAVAVILYLVAIVVYPVAIIVVAITVCGHCIGTYDTLSLLFPQYSRQATLRQHTTAQV